MIARRTEQGAEPDREQRDLHDSTFLRGGLAPALCFFLLCALSLIAFVAGHNNVKAISVSQHGSTLLHEAAIVDSPDYRVWRVFPEDQKGFTIVIVSLSTL